MYLVTYWSCHLSGMKLVRTTFNRRWRYSAGDLFPRLFVILRVDIHIFSFHIPVNVIKQSVYWDDNRLSMTRTWNIILLSLPPHFIVGQWYCMGRHNSLHDRSFHLSQNPTTIQLLYPTSVTDVSVWQTTIEVLPSVVNLITWSHSLSSDHY